ncbi:MAG: RNA 2',3'-cyclic phosphodiesterase, partial [Lachnospiraceae bacterium]|nr:RNA 2',3'-cyclic phosphodiesterase [Lachnospiraceae bacterium]
MRLFIVIPLNDEMKLHVRKVQDAFRQFHVHGNFTKQENLHLTLAFIGEYGDPDAVMEALEGVAFTPFRITMDAVGSFEKLWWTGFSESEELEKLAGKVRRALSDAGIPFDRKRFKAHTTILRKPEYAPGSRLGEIPVGPTDMLVTSFSL